MKTTLSLALGLNLATGLLVGCAEPLFHEEGLPAIEPFEAYANEYIESDIYDPDLPYVISLDIRNYGSDSNETVVMDCKWIGKRDEFWICIKLESDEGIRFLVRADAHPLFDRARSFPRYYKYGQAQKKVDLPRQKGLLDAILTKKFNIIVGTWDLENPYRERFQTLYADAYNCSTEPFLCYDAWFRAINRTPGIDWKKSASPEELKELETKFSPDLINDFVKWHQPNFKTESEDEKQ